MCENKCFFLYSNSRFEYRKQKVDAPLFETKQAVSEQQWRLGTKIRLERTRVRVFFFFSFIKIELNYTGLL